MSTLKDLSGALELTGWVLSLSHFLTTVRTEMRLNRGSTHFRPMFFDLQNWSLSPCLNASSAERFITTLRQRFLGTSELVSISQPARTLRPLNVAATERSFDGLNEYIFSLQIGGCVSGGITFARWHRDTNSVVVRHCRFSRTLLLCPDTLELTSRPRAAIASLLTKDFALFVIRSMKGLRQYVGHGRVETELNGVEDCKSWEPYWNSIWTGLPVCMEANSNTECAELYSHSVRNTTGRYRFAQKFQSGQIMPRELVFLPHSSTPFKKNLSSTLPCSNVK